jgi:hypothetical protein
MLRQITRRLTLFLTGASMLGGSLVWAAEGIISKSRGPIRHHLQSEIPGNQGRDTLLGSSGA